jgi:hypothetical protein
MNNRKLQRMQNNHLTKTRELPTSKPTPFVSAAKLVIGVGFGVLGLIGKAIKSSVGLLVKRPAYARKTRGLPMNKIHSIENRGDL